MNSILTSSGNFKEYMLTGGSTILSALISLELINPGEMSFYLNWLYCKFLPISQHAPSVFLSAIASSIVLFAIIIGFLSELFGSILFMVDVRVMQRKIKEDEKSFLSLFPEKILSQIQNNIDDIKNFESPHGTGNPWTLRRSCMNIESFMMLQCVNKIHDTQMGFVLGKISSNRIAQGISNLCLLLFTFHISYALANLYPNLSTMLNIAISFAITAIIILIQFQSMKKSYKAKKNRYKTIAIITAIVIVVVLFAICCFPSDIDDDFVINFSIVMVCEIVLLRVLFNIKREAYRYYINTLYNLILIQYD